MDIFDQDRRKKERTEEKQSWKPAAELCKKNQRTPKSAEDDLRPRDGSREGRREGGGGGRAVSPLLAAWGRARESEREGTSVVGSEAAILSVDCGTAVLKTWDREWTGALHRGPSGSHGGARAAFPTCKPHRKRRGLSDFLSSKSGS